MLVSIYWMSDIPVTHVLAACISRHKQHQLAAAQHACYLSQDQSVALPLDDS